MKRYYTQKLFWKRWLYKATLQVFPTREYVNSWQLSKESANGRNDDVKSIKKWCNSTFEDCGIRREINLSIFLTSESDVNTLVDYWGHRVLAIWQPENDNAKDILLGHAYDVVRSKPWYGKFSIRARIPCTKEFTSNAAPILKAAVNNIEGDWWAAGLLKSTIDSGISPKIYGWGQPLYLYLADNEDAAMLRLHVGNYIERFERIRSP